VAKPARRKLHRAWDIFRVVLVLIVFAAGLAGYRACGLPWPGTAQQARFPVTLSKVVDGDTLHVIDGRGERIKLRLVGIDTAELGTAESFRAALFVAEQLEAAERIELEPEPSDPTDKYGRMLAWVWVTDREGATTLLQEELVRHGLAGLYHDASGSKYYDRLELAYRVRE
jgi:endonuclease YncB( thermonuclease family)